ncbi:Metallo-dependent hydrolase [Daedalea quercina L-15889]|uniref:Metallo-dependent hydrolase n=1 Tax=Daedalea quercina L-15889 TaxID=1314783 RepID=A0A165RY40_9APHY|nr:Metallo-dependent hydrolase [Daedalea quercina L-15889]
MPQLFYGALVTPVSRREYLALPRALLCVSDTGDIAWVAHDVPPSELQDQLARHGLTGEDLDLIELKLGEFLMPGFIDTHTHGPQIPNMGSGQQHELLDWLKEVTFPMEARFSDLNFARQAYESAVRRIVDYGTTTCCYYGTLHLDATKLLADIVHVHGQRAFVGKCNMNRECPDYYVESSAEESISATRALIQHIRSLPPSSPPNSWPLVQPILTPRFAISCTPDLLSSLGTLARSDPQLAIQTHISENANEIAHTKKLFPTEILPNPPPGAGEASERARGTYAGVYDAYGLLRHNTILAHCVHLEAAEIEVIKARNAGVSHCPTSNFNLRSGCAKIGVLLDKGIKVGLGTDVSGGFSPSILRTVQDASICSKVVAMSAPQKPKHRHGHGHGHEREHRHDHELNHELDHECEPECLEHTHGDGHDSRKSFTGHQLPVATLLHLATHGGAEVCGLGGRVGQLEPGRAFDALVVSIRTDAGNPAVWGADLDAEMRVGASGGERGREGGRGKTEKEELEGMLERFLFGGDDRNIRRVYVQGRLIGGKEYTGKL